MLLNIKSDRSHSPKKRRQLDLWRNRHLPVIFLLFLVFAARPAASQVKAEKQILRGTITDRVTGTPLPNANITIQNSNTGTSSDSLGRFRLELVPGRHTLLFRYMGFEPKTITIEILPHQPPSQLMIRLTPIVLPGEAVTVSAEADRPSIANYRIPQKDFSEIPNPLPDPIISLKTLPGVSSTNDQSTFYSVRGGSYDENLILLNGVELFQPVLVRKGVAENPSLINPDMVDKLMLQTGAFSPEFGDKLSSVLTIQYQDTSQQPLSGKVAFSTVKATGLVRGKRGKNFHWIAGVRNINYRYLFGTLQTKGDYRPSFKDLQVYGTWQINAQQQFRFFGLAADSRFDLIPSEWSNSWFLAYSKARHISFDGTESFRYKSRALSLNWNSRWKPNLLSEASLAGYYQNEQENSDVESGFRDENGKNHYQREQFDNQLKISQIRFFQKNNYILNSRHQVQFGMEAKFFRLHDQRNENVIQQEDDLNQFIQPFVSAGKIHTTGCSAFSEYFWRPLAILSLQTGARVTRYTHNRELLFLPKISLRYYLTEKTQLIASTGRYAQPPLYKEFRSQGFQADAGLKAQKETRFTLGLQHEWGEARSVRVEYYYKALRHLISYNFQDVHLIYSGRNDAVGFVYGLDIHVRGEFVPGCLTWLSYGYMVAREDLDFDVGGRIPRPTDQRHTFGASLQDKMERFPGSRLYMRFLFGSGHNYIYRNYRQNEQGQLVVTYDDDDYSYGLQFYRRFDVGMTQKFTLFPNISLTLREEVLNVFDEYNILGYSWIDGAKIEQGLGQRTFNIGAEVRF